MGTLNFESFLNERIGDTVAGMQECKHRALYVFPGHESNFEQLATLETRLLDLAHPRIGLTDALSRAHLVSNRGTMALSTCRA